MKTNLYLVYSEIKEIDPHSPDLFSRTTQCNDLKELIFEVRECVRDGRKNIHITTIQNGKKQ
jgi:hypothetical protein